VSPNTAMKQILVVYYSKTGNTEKIAQALGEELTRLLQDKGNRDIWVVVKKVIDVSMQAVVDACGVASGPRIISPTWPAK
jgi:menaquinone-dependent protoporphyrinogen IX oxidase